MPNYNFNNMPDLMEFIKIQWADIHHSRNQDWKFLAIMVGIFYALFYTIDNIPLQEIITILGVLISSMCCYMSYAHWLIFYSKKRIIETCEKELGIYLSLSTSVFPVQGLLFFIYFFLASIFLNYLAYLFELIGICCLHLTFPGCLIIGLFFCILARERIENKAKRQTSFVVERIKT